MDSPNSTSRPNSYSFKEFQFEHEISHISLEHSEELTGSGGKHTKANKGNGVFHKLIKTFYLIDNLVKLLHQRSCVSLWGQASTTRDVVPAPLIFPPGNDQEVFKSPLLRDSNNKIGKNNIH